MQAGAHRDTVKSFIQTALQRSKHCNAAESTSMALLVLLEGAPVARKHAHQHQAKGNKARRAADDGHEEKRQGGPHCPLARGRVQKHAALGRRVEPVVAGDCSDLAVSCVVLPVRKCGSGTGKTGDLAIRESEDRDGYGGGE
jgi:hypothetical protein